jgi:hypothetical protein
MTELGEKYKIIMEKIASLTPEDIKNITNNPEKLKVLDRIEENVGKLEKLYGIVRENEDD